MAVVGSGPAGLAAADQLNRAGHAVTVYEKSDRIGGLLRYGIPEFKMEKRFLDRRLAVMEAEGVVFQPGVNVGVDLPAERLRGDFDAVLLAGGAGQPRDLPVPGRDLEGIHFAMDYLTLQNRRNEGDAIRRRRLRLRRRQARDHHRRRRHRRRLPGHRAPPAARARCTSWSCCRSRRRTRAASNPWPEWPHIFRVSSAHEEGGERLYQVSTQRFSGDANGRVKALHAVNVELVQKRRPHRVRAGGRQRVRDSRRSGAAGDGVRRARRRARCSTSWA